jgi:hypothetical protein
MNTVWLRSERFSLTDYRYLLAMASPWKEEAEKSLRMAGVVPQLAGVLEEALQALEFQQTDFLLISEGFGASDLNSDPLLEYVQTLSSGARRNFFVVLIGSKFRSSDFWSAFSYSVNLVLHPEHLQELVGRIEKSCLAWKDQYRIFLQSQT